MTPSAPDDARLLAVSARIGADRGLVQGAGGNTSIKDDGVMWVKASGTWLMHAAERPIMVPVALEPLLAAFARGEESCETCLPFTVATLNPAGLRPSIETTMHAVLPERVVIHVHCVDTIAWAVDADAPARLAPLLAGLPWAFVPYVRPGVPLTRGIVAARKPDTTVFVLGNHGLVVAAETVEDAEALLAEVRRRLALPVRPAPAPDLERLARLAAGSAYRLPHDESLHAAATDPARLAVARLGSLYPDHVIFLGPGVVALEAGETLAEAEHRAARPVPLLLVPGAGALVRTGASAGVEPLGGCLADVTGRLNPDAPIRVLTAEDEDALVNWDAEKYRQTLDRRHA
jgi:rhamnose utilization protein RhaD (predicted bifunctional aldolase and dehydrogenase)